ADREHLARATEDDLLMSDEAWEAYGVHADARDVGAARAFDRLGAWRSGVGDARLGHALGRGPGGPRGRVGLILVMQLDDLGGGQNPGCLRRKALHEHR